MKILLLFLRGLVLCKGRNVLFLIPVCLLWGCAYHLRSAQRQLPEDHQSIAVPFFVNRTLEPGIEVAFTNSLRREFLRSKVVPLKPEAEAETRVLGVVRDLVIEAENRNIAGGLRNLYPESTVLNASYQIQFTIDVELQRTADKRVLWSISKTKTVSYKSPDVGLAAVNTVNANYNVAMRRKAIEEAAGEVMAEVHNLITDSF